jgi:hypothetical protein
MKYIEYNPNTVATLKNFFFGVILSFLDPRVLFEFEQLEKSGCNHSVNKESSVFESFGLGSWDMLPRDIIAVIPSLNVPAILQPVGEEKYEVIGDAYIHMESYINGKALVGYESDLDELEMIKMV